jgi:hypothetical protein
VRSKPASVLAARRKFSFATEREKLHIETSNPAQRAIEYAFKRKIPMRLIIDAGSMRDISKADTRLSRIVLRLLDSEEGWVERYNAGTGEC